MTVYSCKCCKFETAIKSHLDKHNETKKHLKRVADEQEGNIEIQELREIVENHEQTITNMAAEIAALKSSLQECKALILSNIKKPPTYEAPPTPLPSPQVIYVAPEPKPEPKKETCNPMYIAKKLDEDPDNKDILNIVDFFKIGNEQIDFDFDDINDMKDVGKKYAIDKITDFVKNNKKILPFRYQKSSWYIKGNNGWEREIVESNKNCKTGTDGYNFSIIVKSFIGIFEKRFFKYFNEKMGDVFMNHNEFDRIYAEVLSREGYRNSDILKSIGNFC